MIRKMEWLVLGIILLIAGGFALNWVIESAIHAQKEIQVPDLVNKSLDETLEILAKNNLGLKKDGAEFNDAVPAGTVLRQQPDAGSTVREGKIIRVVVSQGGEIIVLPDLKGQSLRTAEITLRNHFMALGEIETQPSILYEKDMVISQNPPAKSIMKRNALVHLTISDGPPADGSILMPNFTGKDWSDVLSWAKNSGMQVQKTEDPNASAASGVVTAQSAEPDKVLKPGSSLNFTVSANRSGTVSTQRVRRFHFEVPQGTSSKLYSFILVEPSGTQEIWRGELEPGSKHDVPLPAKLSPNAKIRILVNGILTEERNAQ